MALPLRTAADIEIDMDFGLNGVAACRCGDAGDCGAPNFAPRSRIVHVKSWI
jgi:hypothetical protein